MGKAGKIAIVIAFLAIASGIVISKQLSAEKKVTAQSIETTEAVRLPRLLDLGAKSCVPCKMMVPVLDTLTTVYEGKLTVEFIDVWADAEAGNKYGIRSIPTQIFYDNTGTERFRHEGFWSRAEIEAKFAELGINLNGTK